MERLKPQGVFFWEHWQLGMDAKALIELNSERNNMSMRQPMLFQTDSKQYDVVFFAQAGDLQIYISTMSKCQIGSLGV